MLEYFLRHSDKILEITTIFFISILVRIALQSLGQRWIMTTAHTATIILLPLITYTITNIIAGDIALSLGMVGALSIVRFRNPVRSPLELSIYFGLITLGITASVSLMWVLLFACSVACAVFGLISIHFISLYFFNTPFFHTSFSEGNSLSTLEIITNSALGFLDNHELLIMKRKNGDSVQYILSSASFDKLKEVIQSVSNDNEVQDYTLTR